jgi:predicted DNA-binding transcriptional regulator AlpA
VKRLLTIADVAAELGVPLKSVYGYCAPAGDLPVVRIGKGQRQLRVLREDLDAWIARRRVAPTDDKAIAREVANRSIADLPGANRYTDDDR